MTSAAYAYVKLRYDDGVFTVDTLETLVTKGRITQAEMDEILLSS